MWELVDHIADEARDDVWQSASMAVCGGSMTASQTKPGTTTGGRRRRMHVEANHPNNLHVNCLECINHLRTGWPSGPIC